MLLPPALLPAGHGPRRNIRVVPKHRHDAASVHPGQPAIRHPASRKGDVPGGMH
jgi:hypothetical protein